jgi:uridine kinase
MSASSTLSILVEETYQEIIPSEIMRDPVDKMRVSTPQALIDTDFEYGVQPTKWESISLCNNRPSVFIDYTQPVSNTSSNTLFTGSSGAYLISNVAASGKVITVTINNTTGITVGKPFFIQGTLDAFNVDGWWIVEAVTTNTSFTFTVINTPAATLFDALKVYLYFGDFYTNSAIPAGTSSVISISAGSIATVTTANAHGLQVNNAIYITGTTGATGGTARANGSFLVASVPQQNMFTCNMTGLPTGGTVTTTLNGSIYSRPMGYVEHRPFDGGVQFSNVTPYQGYQVVRQTRRYFRYQSGKAIQFSTGSILKPSLSVDSITSSGATVTVSTKYPHGLLTSANVAVSGAVETAYNGIFTVTGATANSFTYTASSTPTAPTANGFPITVSPSSWYGSSNRIGMFDSQNGFYFEFDGQTLYAVKRSSTLQISGTSSVVLCMRILRETISRNDFFRLSRKPFVMGVAGDSGSGKDTFSEALQGLFGAHSVTLLSGDDYHLWDRQKPIWQVMTPLNPKANDLERFSNHLVSLTDGKPIHTYHYDHRSGKMTMPFQKKTNDFIIASGLHALYLPILRDCYNLSVYLEIDEALRRYFKIKRDVNQRGHTLEHAEASLERREPDAARFIRPQATYADLVLSLQPIHPRILTNINDERPLRFKLSVRTRHGLNEISLIRVLVGVCGLHVDMSANNDGSEVVMTIEGDASAEDIAMAAQMLCPRVLEFLDTQPKWQDGVMGLMQLITLSHISQALTKRFI